MKVKFVTLVAAASFSVISAFATGEDKLIVNAGNIEHLAIASDMDIVLMPGDAGDGSISMDANATGKLNMKLSGNTLTLEAARGAKQSKPTVYLYVRGLKTITVENNSLVNTIGVIDSRQLDVFVDSDARVHLRTTGSVQAHSISDTDLEVRYLSQAKVSKK